MMVSLLAEVQAAFRVYTREAVKHTVPSALSTFHGDEPVIEVQLVAVNHSVVLWFTLSFLMLTLLPVLCYLQLYKRLICTSHV